MCFPSARIRFVGPSGDGGPGPTFSPALFYVGDEPGRFERVFAGIGAVWVVPGNQWVNRIAFQIPFNRLNQIVANPNLRDCDESEQ